MYMLHKGQLCFSFPLRKFKIFRSVTKNFLYTGDKIVLKAIQCEMKVYCTNVHSGCSVNYSV